MLALLADDWFLTHGTIIQIVTGSGVTGENWSSRS